MNRNKKIKNKIKSASQQFNKKMDNLHFISNNIITKFFREFTKWTI